VSLFALHKPYGYLSQFVNNGPKKGKKKLLGELYEFPPETMAIGRLDEPSEGLLLLTTDGKQSEWIRSSKVEKEYFAQLDGLISEEAIQGLKDGVEISINKKKYRTQKCKVRLIPEPDLAPRVRKIRDARHGPTSWISITLREGKFRQVRKMTAAIGFPTLRLVRVRIGNIHLGEMKVGEVIEIKPSYIKI
jgi:23S rRNA pseudouridine2457 synthase